MIIAIYTTAHGYGHTSRCHEIARALVEADENTRVYFNSWAPDSFFSNESHLRIHRRLCRLDAGIRQMDSLTMDLPGTLADLNGLADRSEELIQREVDYLCENRIELILADLPPLAFEAAYRANIPIWGVSNFSWDWIYEAYLHDFPELHPHILRIRRAYQKAERLLRLPFAGEMSAFRHIVDVPLVARVSKLGKSAARKKLGFADHNRIILFSFGGFQLRIPSTDKYEDSVILLSTDPSPDPGFPFIHLSDSRLEALNLRYCDLVAAADAVVSKPGYGIVAECIANRTPLLYTPRGHFREYPILVAEMKEVLPATEISIQDFSSHCWLEAFKRIVELPFPSPVRCDGAMRIAEMVLSRRKA